MNLYPVISPGKVQREIVNLCWNHLRGRKVAWQRQPLDYNMVFLSVCGQKRGHWLICRMRMAPNVEQCSSLYCHSNSVSILVHILVRMNEDVMLKTKIDFDILTYLTFIKTDLVLSYLYRANLFTYLFISSRSTFFRTIIKNIYSTPQCCACIILTLQNWQNSILEM